jgi:hypothetical protein
MTLREAEAIARRDAKPLPPGATDADRAAAVDAYYRTVATLMIARPSPSTSRA